jgi:hypothetical protein
MFCLGWQNIIYISFKILAVVKEKLVISLLALAVQEIEGLPP